MTVTTTLDRQYFPGDGANKNFPFNFKFFDNSQIYVFLIAPDGSIVGRTLNVDYTLSGALSPGGGQVSMVVAPPVNYRLLVQRILSPTQPTSIRNQGAFFPAIHEDVFDRLTMLVQQSLANDATSLQLDQSDTMWDFKGKRGINASDPVNAQDVATKNWVGLFVDSVSGLINTTLGIAYDAGNLFEYLRFGVGRTVDSISSLRSLSSNRNQRAMVLGYLSKFDGGGGEYFVDQADTTSADNGGTIIVASDGARWKLKKSDSLCVEQFGCLPIAGRNNYLQLQKAIEVCALGKIKLTAGNGTFEYGSTLDIDYPTLVLTGGGFRNTIFKFTGSGTAMQADGLRPNNGIYSFDLDLSEFTIEGNSAATDLLRTRINHCRFVRINLREASTTNGCGLRILGVVAGHFEQITCSTNTQLMSSRPQNGIVISTNPLLSNTRATCNTLISPCIEGTTGDGIALLNCDQLTIIGGTSENNAGNGLFEAAGGQMNTFIGFDCESNLGFADIFIAGQSTRLINCGSTKYTYIDNSARLTKIEGGWYDKVEVGAGAVAVTLDGIKTRFFGGTVGLVTNNNPFLSTRNIYDVGASAFVFFGKPASAIGLTASPMNYTNSNVTDETILVAGGTVTQIIYIRLGTPYPLSPSTGAIRLQPGDGVTISYTGTPTVTRIPGGTNHQ